MPQITTATINERIREHFQSCLNKSLEWTQLLPIDPFIDIGREVIGLRESVEQMRAELAAQTFSQSVVTDANALLQQSHPGAPPADLEARQYACNAILRARIEDHRILAAQLSGRYDQATPLDPLFAGMMANGLPPIPGEAIPAEPQTVTVRAAGKLYCAHKGKHDWVPKTAADVKRVLGLAEQAIGPERPLCLLSSDDVKAVRDLIGALPPNFSKHKINATMTAKDVIEKNGVNSTFSLKTQDKYFGLFKAFLQWAVDEGHLGKMPGPNIKIAGVAKLNGFDKRLPYAPAKLQAIFQSPLYVGHRCSYVRQAGAGLA